MPPSRSTRTASCKSSLSYLPIFILPVIKYLIYISDFAPQNYCFLSIYTNFLQKKCVNFRPIRHHLLHDLGDGSEPDTLRPGEAFFVQAPDEVDAITFHEKGRYDATKIEIDQNACQLHMMPARTRVAGGRTLILCLIVRLRIQRPCPSGHQCVCVRDL